MINKEVKYGLKDIEIVQAAVSNISSRSECNPYGKSGMLPLFTAPMSSVVDLNNYQLFKKNKITPIIPRTVDFQIRKEMCSETWCAFSWKEFYDMTLYCEFENGKHYVLIDIANGNISDIHNTINKAKIIYGDNLAIMAGNIANPEAYVALCEAGADYVRCGIGGGNGCITSSNTGIHYPMASLISECFDASLKLNNPAKIVADGGIKGYSDIIKCLALGADFCMVGSVFNKMLESAGETTNCDNMIINQYAPLTLSRFNEGIVYNKVFYGMSTKKAQKELGNTNLKTSEGIERVQKVEYTMSQWTENFTAYLKCAMSYTNSNDLDDFIGEVETIVISQAAQNAINK